MSSIKRIISNCIKFVLFIQLPVLTIAQSDSNTSESRHFGNTGFLFNNNEQMLISADSGIALSVQSLSGENDSTIIGDFAITFNRSLSSYDENQLLLKNAQAGYVLKNNIRILTALQCSSITSTFKDMEYDENSSDSSNDYYTFACGPVTMSVPLEKLSIHIENGLLLVKTSQVNIIDEKNKLCRIYVNGSDSTAITLNYLLSGEIKEHFHTKNDTFCISTTKTKGSNQGPVRYRFSATRVDFWVDKKSTDKKWMIRLSSSDDTMAGPRLREDIMEPRYFDKEFTIENQLEKPVFLNGSDSSPNLYVDWTKTGKRNKLLITSNGLFADYRGWNFRLRQCSLTPDGIIFDLFDIRIPYPFSEENNSTTNENFICGFKGLKISCFKDNDNMTIYGSASALSPSVNQFTSTGYCMIEKIQKCVFTPGPVNSEYLLQIIHNGLLHLPATKNTYFNEKSDIIVNIDTLEFSSQGIVRLRAEGPITKTFGDADGEKNETVKPLLALHGKMLVRYLARDFQLYVNPLEGKPLFSLPAGGLFDNGTSIGLPKESIGLFSDLTINTMYIKGEFDKNKTITPAELGNRVKFKVPGIDIMQTSNGPQLILHAPKAALMSGKKQSGAPHYYDIDQVMLDMNKKIRAINGNVYIGGNKPDPFVMLLPESIQKSFSFKTDVFSIGSRMSSADSSIQLKINGVKTSLSFKESFKSIGLYGFRLPLESLRIVSTPATSWRLDCIDGKSINIMQLHSINRSSVQTIKTKMTTADTSDDAAIIRFNSCGFRVNSDTVSGGIMVTIPQSNLEVTGSFPFIPVRKFSSFQDIRIIVKKDLPFPYFVNINSEVKKRASVSIGNLDFKNTETWFGSDTLLNSSNTSCSNLFLGFSFKELLKDSVSLYSVEEASQPCVLNLYLDGSWRIAYGDIVKTLPDIPVLLEQCFSKK